MNCMGIYIAMALTGLFIGITFFRMYCRTGMKSHLLISLGSVIGLIGAVGILISYNIGDEKIVDILTQILVIPGTLLIVCGIILISTIESGAAKDALSGHSIFDIILGNISSLEKGKYTPTLSKAGGIIVVTILIIYGIVKC